MRTIAALFVDARGSYSLCEGVELWTESAVQQGLFSARVHADARAYAGPHPVVAHPPCARWCRLAGLVEKRWGHERGEDGGAFASALASVRAWGGVLEHPAYSDAWEAFGLLCPPRDGGWVRADDDGGSTCYVEQGRYGHAAKKATWLYACRAPLPELRWGATPDRADAAWVSWCGNATRGAKRRRLTKREAIATPPAFRDELLALARGVR